MFISDTFQTKHVQSMIKHAQGNTTIDEGNNMVLSIGVKPFLFISSAGFPLSKPDLLSWMDRGEDLWVPDLQDDSREILKDASPGEKLSHSNGAAPPDRKVAFLKQDGYRFCLGRVEYRCSSVMRETA